LPRGKTSKNSKRGIPNLTTLKNEPLNTPFTLKLWPSISRYLEKNGGPDFIREAILEKLERILNEPTPARCSDCKNLKKTKGQEEAFCKKLLAYIYKGTLSQKFSCNYFQPSKDMKKEMHA